MEKDEGQLQFARRLAALDMGVERIDATADLDTAENDELYLPVAGGLYPLAGRIYQAQIRHNYFEFREYQSPELL